MNAGQILRNQVKKPSGATEKRKVQAKAGTSAKARFARYVLQAKTRRKPIFSKKIAVAIKSVIPCNRIGVAILGLEVPHAHIHLVPMDTMEDVNFKNPKLKFTTEEFKDIATRISRTVIL